MNKKIENKKVVKKTSKEQPYWVWPVKVFFLAFALSMFFSITSEFLLSDSGIIVSIIIILVLIVIAVITDMIGVAVTAASQEPFRAMASRKVRGAKESLLLLKHADRVSSLCADVIGDVCGILSGAAGTSILVKVVINASAPVEILVASLISSFIAGLTIFGKAMGKKLSMQKCNSIVFAVGKFLSLFSRQERVQKKKSNTQTKTHNDKEKVSKDEQGGAEDESEITQ